MVFCRRQPIHDRQEKRGQYEGHQNADAPSQIAITRRIDVHKTLQHVDRRNGNDRRQQLDLEVSKVDMAHP
jgi:hypothetical protein